VDQNFWYLFSAYTIVLIGQFLYIYSLAGREKKLEEQIEELKAAVSKLESKDTASS